MSETDSQPNSGAEQPRGDSAPVSFRDRAMDRLEGESRPHRDDANFDDKPSNLNQADLNNQDDEQVAHQPEAKPHADSLDKEFNLSNEQPKEDIDDGVDDSNVEDVIDDPEVASIRQRAEDAEAKLESFQTDYTQKTQKLGAQRRELVSETKKSQQVAEMYVTRANQNLARFSNVNWQQLQSTLDPQAYSQRVGEYRQVVAQRDRAVNEHQQIVGWVDEVIDKQLREQAEDSREILSKTIDNWGNEHYVILRDFAVENLGFAADEVDVITDHRIMRLLHDSWLMSNTGKRVQSIQQHGRRNSPPNGPNKGRPIPGGNSRKIQERHEQNPGNREASRNFFEDRLRKERTRR